MKKQMIVDFEDRLPQLSDLESGYLYKGTKRWIEDNQDLDAMYKAFNCGDEIAIWCEGHLPEHLLEPQTKSGQKRKAQKSEETSPTKKCDLIDQTAQELYEKHGERFAMPQLRLWAGMVVNKQYMSLDIPPPIPSLVPRAHPKNRERGLVTLAKIPVCAVSAVFIWRRGITFVHYQLLN